VNDTAGFLQPSGGSVNVTANDLHPVNPACITAIYGGGTAFAINGCNNITYTPDSTFTGTDTVWYVVCDNGHPTWCDTAMLVVTSNQNPALLPTASYTTSIQTNSPSGCTWAVFYNTSINSDSVVWTTDVLSSNADSVFNNQDSLIYYGPIGTDFNFQTQVCLTTFNQFGSSSICDTVELGCGGGISEVALASIKFYPNPGDKYVILDMSQNQDEITRNYTGIEIFNGIGEKVKTISERNNRLVNVPVADLPEGMYLATIVDAKGTRRTLGRFSVVH
jgi:hypothetical protein